MHGSDPIHTAYLQRGSHTFCVLVPSQPNLKKWLEDSATPLVDVIAPDQIFKTEHGNQGIAGAASNAELENAFGKKTKDEMIIEILTQGNHQPGKPPGAGGTKDSH